MRCVGNPLKVEKKWQWFVFCRKTPQQNQPHNMENQSDGNRVII